MGGAVGRPAASRFQGLGFWVWGLGLKGDLPRSAGVDEVKKKRLYPAFGAGMGWSLC